MSYNELVLNHLSTRNKITSIEAIGLYGITRLAAVVFDLKKKGHPIQTTMKAGIKSKYAEYSFEH
ncbi:helix-turn-helix domain-containing protein [Oceanospirillaceae bacterium]|jgi:hypothetical protein|nr:helix-turn-helix domain-containing protein [Oceanospirillaceae bacterium]